MTGEDDKIIRPAFGDKEPVVPAKPGGIVLFDEGPKSNVDGSVVVSRRELREFRGRLQTIMIEACSLEAWVGRILGEDDHGDAG